MNSRYTLVGRALTLYRIARTFIFKDVFEGKEQPWRLGKFFGDVSFATKDEGRGFERELEGVCNQNALLADRFVTKELMNNLFNSRKVAEEANINLRGTMPQSSPNQSTKCCR